MQEYCVYIITNCKNGTLYVGMTNNLLRRVIEHKRKVIKGFTEKYSLTRLECKINIINEFNPEWKDLFYEIGGNDDMLDNNFKLY